MWYTESGVALHGDLGFAGVTVCDIDLVDITRSEAGRLMLHRAVHEVGAWWRPYFLLLASKTTNLDAVGYVPQRSKIRAFLRREPCAAGGMASADRHTQRLLGNGAAPGDVALTGSMWCGAPRASLLNGQDHRRGPRLRAPPYHGTEGGIGSHLAMVRMPYGAVDERQIDDRAFARSLSRCVSGPAAKADE